MSSYDCDRFQFLHISPSAGENVVFWNELHVPVCVDCEFLKILQLRAFEAIGN